MRNIISTGQRHWFFVAVYAVGFAGVVCAGLSLAAATWLEGSFTAMVAFDVFHQSLAVAVTAFLIGCAGEVCVVVAQTPHPKSLRGTVARENGVVATQIDEAKARLARAA